MFSVLMSLYYKENKKNLDECLLSLEKQTLTPSEIIIVYDGPIPNELNKIVEKYKETLNIIVVFIESNIGLGLALNTGLEYCNYEIVARMDTDDICEPSRFEYQIPYFKDNNLDLLGSSVIEFNDRTNKTREKKLPLNSNEIFKYSLFKNPFNHMSVVFRKTSVKKVGGYKHHLYMEDYNLWLRMISNKYKVENSSLNLLRVRVNDDMILRRKGFLYIKSEYILFKLKNNLFPGNKILNLIFFITRVSTRILPTQLLKKIYDFDRRKC